MVPASLRKRNLATKDGRIVVLGEVVAEEKTHQHIVPQGYLRAWIPPGLPQGKQGQVWLIQKGNPQEKRLRSPKTCFRKDDHYTVTGPEGRDLQIENALAYTENNFAKVMERVRKKEQVSKKEFLYLSFFVAAMLSRVETFTEPVAEMMRGVQRQTRQLEDRCNGDHEQSDELARALINVTPIAVNAGIINQQRILALMNLTIFTVDDDAGFITSDVPCSLYIPAPSWIHASLYDRDIQLTLPLSPRQVAIYSWKMGRAFQYLNGTKTLLNEINRRTLGWCKKEFVSWKGIVPPS